jgi:hypothetical protein
MKAFINLGCHGRKVCGLTMCPGTNNRIADLRRLKADQDHVVDYLDQHCHLFDRMAVDLNKINNIVNLLAREGIIIKQIEQTLYDFFAMHRKCGFYMYVDPMDEEV